MMMMMMMMMMMKKKKKNKVIISTIEQDHLSEDLILEILSRLPPITLVRFKSVSKTWYSLISNPDFCRRNTALYQFHISSNRNHIHDDHGHMLEEPWPSPPGILLRRRFCVGKSNIVIHPHPCGLDHEQKNLALLLKKLNDYRPAALSEPSVTHMLTDSCNGLLLYVQKNFTRKEENRTFYVCNPITNDYIELPTIDMVDMDPVPKLHKINIAHIVFNPSFSLTYKVFTWIPCVERSTSSRSGSSRYYGRLYVYSSEARSWRLSVSIPIIEFLLLLISEVGSKAVLWNGVLHWSSFLGGITDYVLPLCYDIEKETVWKMKFPKMATGYTHRRLLYFGLCSGERLLMIEKQYKHDDVPNKYFGFPSSFDVWEKQEQNGEENKDMWTVRYRVNFEEVDNNFYSKVIGSNSAFDTSILDIYRSMRTKNEEVVEEEVMLMKVRSVGNDRNHRIIFFNLTSNTFGNEKLRNRKTAVLPNIGILDYADILQYNVTLFPP